MVLTAVDQIAAGALTFGASTISAVSTLLHGVGGVVGGLL